MDYLLLSDSSRLCLNMAGCPLAAGDYVLLGGPRGPGAFRSRDGAA